MFSTVYRKDVSKQRRGKIEFVADQKISKPVKVEFYTKDGEKVPFKKRKGATKPVKVEFYTRYD